MRIVVLDGYTMNSGDLSWAPLQALGELILYERTEPEQVVERAKGAQVVLTNKVPIQKDALAQLPDLEYIGVTATGYNIIDVGYAAQKGIVVTNVPGYSTASVAQLTFALLLESCFHVQRHSDRVKQGAWSQAPDFSFRDYPLMELAGKTLGIIGFGTIGKKVADIAAAFDMQVLAHSRTQTDQSHRENFRWVTQEALLQSSDVVSLHCPLTEKTKGLINQKTLDLMQAQAFLINTSRGGLIVEQDLADALNGGQIAGAGLDVLSKEPPAEANPLLSAKNCFITPHIGWASTEARVRLMDTTVTNLQTFLRRQSVNQVL